MIIKVKSTEAAAGTGSGTGSNVSSATCVRAVNSGTTARLVTVEVAGGTDIGTFTMPGGTVEYIEKDHYYSEFKHQETMSQRLDLARNSEEYVGKYYSKEWFRANILRQTAAEVEKQDELIAKEAEEEGGGEEEGGEEEY